MCVASPRCHANRWRAREIVEDEQFDSGSRAENEVPRRLGCRGCGHSCGDDDAFETLKLQENAESNK